MGKAEKIDIDILRSQCLHIKNHVFEISQGAPAEIEDAFEILFAYCSQLKKRLISREVQNSKSLEAVPIPEVLVTSDLSTLQKGINLLRKKQKEYFPGSSSPKIVQECISLLEDLL